MWGSNEGRMAIHPCRQADWRSVAQPRRPPISAATAAGIWRERISELEATTARKGNRKVSLTISGWVNEAVFFWDDGTEQQRLRRHEQPRAVALQVRRRSQDR